MAMNIENYELDLLVDDIDSRIFTGLPSEHDCKELKSVCERWIRELDRHIKQYEEENDDG